MKDDSVDQLFEKIAKSTACPSQSKRPTLTLVYLEDYSLFRNLTKPLSSIIAEENMGFKKDDEWFVFPEEGLELLLLKKARIYQVEEDKLEKDSNPLRDESHQIPIIELSTTSSALLHIYGERAPRSSGDEYLNTDIWRGYAYLKRKNFAVLRYDLEKIIQRIWSLSPEPSKKQKKDEESIAKPEEILGIPLFEVYETSMHLKSRTPSYVVAFTSSAGVLDGKSIEKLLGCLGAVPLKLLVVNVSSFLLLDIGSYRFSS